MNCLEIDVSDISSRLISQFEIAISSMMRSCSAGLGPACFLRKSFKARHRETRTIVTAIVRFVLGAIAMPRLERERG
jgi:hypothetical protein